MIEMGEGKNVNGREKMKKTIKKQNKNNEIIKY